MMQFGLTQFGMTTIGAITLVTGAALATADVTGSNEVTRLFAGQGDAYATVTGYGRRAANQLPVTAYAYGLGNSAPAQVTFNLLPSTALGMALVTARAQVDFSTYGFGSAATASGYGDSRRLTKIYPLRAECTAEGEAGAQTWQMAYANPAMATAIGFGTTYHLVYGQAVCTATISDSPRLQIGAAGTALATCALNDATALFQIGVSGLGDCQATANGDPAYKRAGVRYFEVNGDAMAMAMALSTYVEITQAQTGRGYAFAEGSVRYNFGGHGQAICTAIGYADPLVMGTGASLNAGNTTAYGYGAPVLQSHGFSTASGVATGVGAGEKKLTRQYTNPALAYANVAPVVVQRESLVSGQAHANATGQTLFTAYAVKLNPGNCTAMLLVNSITLALYPTPAEAFALTEVDALKILIGAGVADASATASGYNEINDLVHAPAERTVTVEAFDRLVVLVPEPRTVLV